MCVCVCVRSVLVTWSFPCKHSKIFSSFDSHYFFFYNFLYLKQIALVSVILYSVKIFNYTNVYASSVVCPCLQHCLLFNLIISEKYAYHLCKRNCAFDNMDSHEGEEQKIESTTWTKGITNRWLSSMARCKSSAWKFNNSHKKIRSNLWIMDGISLHSFIVWSKNSETDLGKGYFLRKGATLSHAWHNEGLRWVCCALFIFKFFYFYVLFFFFKSLNLIFLVILKTSKNTFF